MNTSARLIAGVSARISALTGVQLGERQKHMVETKIRLRVAELELQSLEEYETYLSENEESELIRLVTLLTTHHTYFFRESSHFEYLQKRALEGLVARARARGEKRLRFWSAACSYGQEVYTLAMVLAEHLPKIAPDFDFEILGTDVDPESILFASSGVFPLRQMAGIPEDYLEKYWVRGTGDISNYFRPRKEIREKCRFETANLLAFTGLVSSRDRFDAILCRNVFIYFSPEQAGASCKALARSLFPEGLLFLGLSESLAGFELDAVSLGPSIYQPRSRAASVAAAALAAASAPVALPSHVPVVTTARVRALIVDDSPTIRRLLERVLSEDPDIEVVGSTGKPSEVEALIRQHSPNVMTLDLKMPEMDGLTLLKKVYPLFRVPAVVVSSYSAHDGATVLEALEAGAVDYIQKPSLNDLPHLAEVIREKVKVAAQVQASPEPSHHPDVGAFYSADLDLDRVIAIGASTGGPDALRRLLSQLPEVIPPILVVQHIPPVFSRALAERLDQLCRCKVKEAEEGDTLEPGRVLIAPGSSHLRLKRASGKWVVALDEEAPVGGHRPSVDVLFDSVARAFGNKVIGVLLTGMGRDGAKGLLEIKRQGGITVIQDAATSVVYGMPRAARELGAVDHELPLQKIPGLLLLLSAFRKVAA